MKKLLFLIAVFTLFTSHAGYSATTWFMPEGSTQGSFDLYILVNNSSSSEAAVKYTFYTDTETITLTSTNAPSGFSGNCTIAAGTRATLNVNSLATQTGFTGLSGKPISTKVESTNGVNIVAERAMYWSGSTMPWDAGHATRGVSGAEGCFTEIGQPSSAYSSDILIPISSSGSYKLISDITCSTAEMTAIIIIASNVTLDLNGFTITGPGNVGSSGPGIRISGDPSELHNITIKNGTIEEFKGSGINVDNASNILIDSVICNSNHTSGIQLENTEAAIVQNCQCAGNTTSGINLDDSLYSIVKNNTCTGNGIGIYLTGTSGYNRIERNTCLNSTGTDEISEPAVTTNNYIYNIYGSAGLSNVAGDETTLDDSGLNELL